MRTIRISVLLTAFLALPLGVALAQPVPPQLKAEADRAFSNGHEFFIWYDGTEPIKGETLDFSVSIAAHLSADFRCVARNSEASPSYLISTTVLVVSSATKERTLETVTFGGPEGFEPKSCGKVAAQFTWSEHKLTGEGYADILLIARAASATKTVDKKAEPRPLSNTIRVKIKF